ncbi:hypothetical protein GPALN_003006 [Globodera pallida]|nr:hypothetical protein GPALN_003006 [Globodera pallida]
MSPLRFSAVFLFIALFALVGLNNAQKGPENAADAVGEPNEASPLVFRALLLCRAEPYRFAMCESGKIPLNSEDAQSAEAKD